MQCRVRHSLRMQRPDPIRLTIGGTGAADSLSAKIQVCTSAPRAGATVANTPSTPAAIDSEELVCARTQVRNGCTAVSRSCMLRRLGRGVL